MPILEFLTGTEWTPLFANQHFGVLPLVAGTMLVSAIAMVVALPMGLLAAIYLSEYAPSGFRRVVKPILEILAGVPTVVYGYFALTFVTPLLQTFFPTLSGFNALSPGLVMGMMILPLVSSLSEDAMRARAAAACAKARTRSAPRGCRPRCRSSCRRRSPASPRRSSSRSRAPSARR